MMPNSNANRNPKSLRDARLCQPFSIKNRPLNSTKIQRIIAAAQYASAEYRAAVSPVYVKRAVAAAAARTGLA